MAGAEGVVVHNETLSPQILVFGFGTWEVASPIQFSQKICVGLTLFLL